MNARPSARTIRRHRARENARLARVAAYHAAQRAKPAPREGAAPESFWTPVAGAEVAAGVINLTMLRNGRATGLENPRAYTPTDGESGEGTAKTGEGYAWRIRPFMLPCKTTVYSQNYPAMFDRPYRSSYWPLPEWTDSPPRRSGNVVARGPERGAVFYGNPAPVMHWKRLYAPLPSIRWQRRPVPVREDYRDMGTQRRWSTIACVRSMTLWRNFEGSRVVPTPDMGALDGRLFIETAENLFDTP